MKNLTLAGNIIQIGAVAYFASSFFVKDNEKAVKRRWTAIGIGAAGYVLTLVPKFSKA